MKNNTLFARHTHSAQGPTVPLSLARGRDKPGGVTFLQADGSEDFYSFAEVADRVEERARQLLSQGLEKGDSIGIVLPNNDDFFFTFLGAQYAGIVPVPMYPPMSFGKLDAYLDTAERILTAGHCKALLTDTRVQGIVWSLVPRVKCLEYVICVSELGQPDPGIETPNPEAIGLDDIAFVQFTSGSTSAPKGVVVTHRKLLANLEVIMRHGLQITADDIAVSWLPMYHDMGLIGFMLAPLWYSTPVVYIPTLSFVRRPTLWMKTCSRFKATLAFAPNFAYALAQKRTSVEELKSLDLSAIKALGCGAEPNHRATLEGFSDHFAAAGLDPKAILPVYGMAEATLAMTFSSLGSGVRVDHIDADAYQQHQLAHPVAGTDRRAVEFVSCGRVLPHHELTIIDERGQQLEDRHVGEIRFTGPSVTDGYHQNPEATAATFRSDGLRTGDLGYLVDGELFVTGRKKDLVILNGRNYDPQSIEWAVADLDGIRKGNVVAFSRPTAQSEELIVAAEIKNGTILSPQAKDELKASIIRHLGEHLSLRVAEAVLLEAGQLPKTSSGKLQRSRARDLFLSGALGTQGNRTLGSRAQQVVLVKHLARSFAVKVQTRIRRHASRVFTNLRGNAPEPSPLRD